MAVNLQLQLSDDAFRMGESNTSCTMLSFANSTRRVHNPPTNYGGGAHIIYGVQNFFDQAIADWCTFGSDAIFFCVVTVGVFISIHLSSSCCETDVVGNGDNGKKKDSKATNMRNPKMLARTTCRCAIKRKVRYV